ncbi:hypothetical protein GGR52DRAFT_574723 [Hypoxylon sp. FL1284]|nr:hypothetical protein GGR52DRAFT_574723 [Hypoxylon sp. FL1284]
MPSQPNLASSKTLNQNQSESSARTTTTPAAGQEPPVKETKLDPLPTSNPFAPLASAPVPDDDDEEAATAAQPSNQCASSPAAPAPAPVEATQQASSHPWRFLAPEIPDSPKRSPVHSLPSQPPSPKRDEEQLPDRPSSPEVSPTLRLPEKDGLELLRRVLEAKQPSRTRGRFPVRPSPRHSMSSPTITAGSNNDRTTPQPDEHNRLVLYRPQDYDVVMRDRGHIQMLDEAIIADPPEWLVNLHRQMYEAYDAVRTLGSSVETAQIQNAAEIRQHYTALCTTYNTIASMQQAGIEATEVQIEQCKKKRKSLRESAMATKRLLKTAKLREKFGSSTDLIP